MAGEVRSELVIRLEGGGGMPLAGSGGGTQRPVSRSSDLAGPGQAMSTFAGQRQARWSSVIAAEVARDKQAMAEIHQGLEKLEAMRALEVASARRAREAFAQRVRETRRLGGAELLGQSVFNERAERGLKRAGKTYLKQTLKLGAAAFVSGIVAESFESSGGLASAAGRITAGAAAGAFTLLPGGLASAGAGFAIGALTASVSEIKRQIEDIYQIADKIKARIEEAKEDTRRFFRQAELQMRGIGFQFTRDLDEAMQDMKDEVARGSARTTRYVTANLTGN